ncbi:hypothetical protein HK405_003790 [Cladochytrium tenue]|nr:hypothetical protein HK405_003790 [Cladochytrium tenue]
MRADVFLAAIAACMTVAAAGAAAEPIAIPRPDPTLQRRAVATCTPTSYASSSKDDSPAINAAIKSCGAGGVIKFPAGVQYSVLSQITLTGCSACDLQIEGTLKASDNLTYWATQKAIILVSGITGGATIRSLTGTGVVDGNGQAAWDAFAADSSLVRPTLLYITGSSGVTVSNVYFKNAPNVFHSATSTSSNIVYSSLTNKAISKSTNLPKNTDGFDISGTNVHLSNILVENDDDCVAFKPGANYVSIDTIECRGSHGLSVGSLGKTNADSVQNVIVTNANMINSTKAAGIKVYDGLSTHGTSTVKNVTWSGVTVTNCDYAIQIQQCYGAADTAECTASPSAATLSGIYFTSFTGTTSSKYDPVVGNLDCPGAGTCDVHVQSFSVKAPSGKSTVLCANVPSTVGVTCTSGASG